MIFGAAVMWLMDGLERLLLRLPPILYAENDG